MSNDDIKAQRTLWDHGAAQQRMVDSISMQQAWYFYAQYHLAAEHDAEITRLKQALHEIKLTEQEQKQ